MRHAASRSHLPALCHRRPGAALLGLGLGLALALWLGSPPAAAAGLSFEARDDLCLPRDAAGPEIVHPYGLDPLPAACEEFLASRGEAWLIAWDRALGTPQLLLPTSPQRLSASLPIEPSGDTGRDVALGFIDAHRDLLGLDAGRLAGIEVWPHGGGLLLSALQTHQGIAVRGSSIHVLLTDDLSLRLLRLRAAREIPAQIPPVLTEAEEAAAWVIDSGWEPLSEPRLQLAFPAGPESAEPVWGIFAAVPLAGGGETEVEILYSAADGRRLALLPTVLGFDGRPKDDEDLLVIEGQLSGIYPDPDDMYAMAFQFDPEVLQPIGYAEWVLQLFLAAPPYPSDRGFTTGEGRFTALLHDAPPDPRFSIMTRIIRGMQVVAGTPLHEYWHRMDYFLPGEPAEMLFNEERSEFEAFHLLAAAHVNRGRAVIESIAAVHDLRVDFGETLLAVRIENDDFLSDYSTLRRHIRLASDEIVPRDEEGRWRKIVPTIVYHELGHATFGGITGGFRDVSLNEAVADALAGYLSRVPHLGYCDPETPTAHPGARDLGALEAAWPERAREVAGGALWELWERTLDEIDPDRPGETPESSFAFDLLVLWLASHQNFTGVGWGGLGAEYSPLMGLELLALADEPYFRGNRDLDDGAPNWLHILAAFGGRNLLPHAFIRGDADASGAVDITDPIAIFSHLFLGGERGPCADALDADDSGEIDISDGIRILMCLFSGADALPAPYPDCGWDITARDGLGCGGSPCRIFPSRIEPPRPEEW